jgi:hypothetical protein
MKKNIYWNHPIGSERIVFMVTEKSLDQVKAEGIIPNEAAVLIKDHKEPHEMKAEEYAKHVHIDKVKFDNYDKPSALVFDMDLLKAHYVNLHKQIRANAFKVLDSLQTRALAQKNEGLIAEIENDKQALRNMPDDLDYSQCNTAVEVSRVYPQSLMVDYEQKYKSRF